MHPFDMVRAGSRVGSKDEEIIGREISPAVTASATPHAWCG